MAATPQQIADRALALWQAARAAAQRGHMITAADYRAQMHKTLEELPR